VGRSNVAFKQNKNSAQPQKTAQRTEKAATSLGLMHVFLVTTPLVKTP
jgi:hypothetical protein